jgi:hypothetical protein
MLCQWLWIMVCYAEPVVMHHGVLCWTSGCESWCVIPNQWLWIIVCYAEPVVVNRGVLCWHDHWLSITHHDSQSLPQLNKPWFTTTGSAYLAIIYNHLRIVMYYAEKSGCESWCVILGQWLWIMVCYAEPVVVNRGVLWWASGCVSWCVMLSQCLRIIVFYPLPTMIHKYWLKITHDNSQPMTQHNKPWFPPTGP